MRLHLVDGTFELYRAHFSKRPGHNAPSGQDLKATVGVVQSLLALLTDAEEKATHVAVAFDNPIRSFRNDLFAGYKSDEGVPEEIHSQFDTVEAAVRALGVTVWSMNEFEADDALATAAKKFAGEVEQVRILTPDKDLGQCLLGESVVQVDRIRQKFITEATLRADRGYGPQSVPDFLALVGDTADGIPGIEGWGEKSTAQVLSAYPHLEDIPPSVGQWKVKPRSAEKLSAALQHQRAEATLYRTLATLRTDVPLKEKLSDLEWRGADRKQFDAWAQSIGSTSLAERVHRWR